MMQIDFEVFFREYLAGYIFGLNVGVFISKSYPVTY